MITRRIAAATILAVMVVAGAAVAMGSSTGAAWIDSPLAWHVVGSVPVPIVAHAADPGGVTAVRFDVDGATVAVVETAGNPLELARFSWTPPASGIYVVAVSGQGPGGEWGVPAIVELSVDLDAGSSLTTGSSSSLPSTTSSVGATSTSAAPPGTTATTVTTTTSTTVTTTTSTTVTTTTSTTSSSTTSTTCTLGTPSTGSVSSTNTFSPTVGWTYSACREPESFEIQVSRAADFVRSEWVGSAAGDQRATSVSVGANCTTYYWRIRTVDLGSFGPWSSPGSFFVQTGRSCP